MPGWAMTRVWLQFSVGDRLRLLFTGRVRLDIRRLEEGRDGHPEESPNVRLGDHGARDDFLVIDFGRPACRRTRYANCATGIDVRGPWPPPNAECGTKPCGGVT